MTLKEPGLITKDQNGFTLIELLVAMCIASLIIGAITMTIFQVLVNPAQSSDHMTAIKQVENAVHWMRIDVAQAQVIEPGGSSGFPLKLTWIDWNNNKNAVTYSMNNDTFRRGHVVYDANNTVTDNQTRIVAEHIESDSAMTNCQVVGNVVTIKITVTVTGYMTSSETRLVEIVARPVD
jgi:prepilin-type N-terminal cleavage/methylation domain-containing protein